MNEKIVLIDGHSILNRAFYGLPELTNDQGVHTNAMYGFLNIMFKILEEEKPDYLVVAFDVSAPTFRHKIYDGYKGTRKPAPQEFREQVPLMKELLCAMGIAIVEKEGYEADDLLGTIARASEEKGLTVSVVSGDRDLLQLATDKVKIRIPKTKKTGTEIEDYNAAQVAERYGVTPREFIDLKALMGDSSDNIPGAPGIGEKTAAAIIGKYHALENVYASLDSVTPPKARKSLEENREMVELSRKLSAIDTAVPLEFHYEAARVGNFFTREAHELFKQYHFKSYFRRFEEDAAGTTAPDIPFSVIEDFAKAEEAFRRAMTSPFLGLSLLDEDGELYGAALAFGEETQVLLVGGLITGKYLLDWIWKLGNCENGRKTGYAPGRKIVLMDLKEKMHLFAPFDSSGFVDAGLGAYLLNPLQERYSYDVLAAGYGAGQPAAREELLGKQGLREACVMNREPLCRLAAYEARTACRIFPEMERRLEEQEMKALYYDMELPLIYVLYAMEREGVLVCREDLKEYGAMLGEKILLLEQEIHHDCGEEFNINSPKQLGAVLFEKLKMPFGKKTKSGYSTAADVLERLADEYPVVRKILDYRQMAKLKSTYADGLEGFISGDGRIHGKFNQTVTATGRLSSAEPNLQNIPIRMELGRAIRKVFIPKPGCVFLDADYSQIELRILSSMSGDEKLCEAYRQAEDIHKITAAQVFHVPPAQVTTEMRSNAKAVNFGIIYGISSFGLSQGLSISKKEAEEYIRKYFDTYPTIEAFINGLVKEAKEKGYAVTLFNRRRPVPELKSSNFMQRSFGERIAMNSPIQGTAADIMKIAMLNAYNGLKEAGLSSRMILQVHDEILVEVREGEEEKAAEIIRDAMTSAADLKVPLEIDMKIGKNWLEAH